MLARSPPRLPAQGTCTDMKLLPLLPIAAALMLHAAQAQNAAAINGQITGQINAMYPQLDAIYKDLHAHPEIAFQEVQTAAKLAADMRAIGFEVTEKVGKTGLVAIYKNGAGPTVLVRTELDGLPMEEKSGVAYASKAHAQLDGKDTMVAHSCGHDVHMTSWLGTARTLVALKAQWKGTLMFIASRPRKPAAAPRPCWPTACSRASPNPTTRSPCIPGRWPTAPSATTAASFRPTPTRWKSPSRDAAATAPRRTRRSIRSPSRRASWSTCRP